MIIYILLNKKYPCKAVMKFNIFNRIGFRYWLETVCSNREGFMLRTVNHSQHYVKPDSGVYTDAIERQ